MEHLQHRSSDRAAICAIAAAVTFLVGLALIVTVCPKAAPEHQASLPARPKPITMIKVAETTTVALTHTSAQMPEIPSGPLDYFQNTCARCHMSYGDAYLAIPKPLHGDPLREKIVYMTNGPAQSPIDDDAITKQFDLHLAILSRGPYVWIASNTPGYLAGESFPDTTITVDSNGKTLTAEHNDHHWWIAGNVPSGTPIHAERNGKVIELKVP